MGPDDNDARDKPLAFWLEDLTRRGTLVKPEHTVRGFFFKGMLENLRTLGDEALMRRCQEASGEERFIDFFSYPFSRMTPLMLTALPPLAERHGGAEEALRQMGRQASRDFLTSVAGRALLKLTQGRPRPIISSMQSAFQVAMSYSRSELVWDGPTRGRLHMDMSFIPPPFHEGMMRQLLETTRIHGVRVAAWDAGELLVTCEFSWE